MAQKNADSILSSCFRKPLEYSRSSSIETEFKQDILNEIEYLHIRQRDGWYTIQIKHNESAECDEMGQVYDREYLTFRIVAIERIGDVHTGTLSNIGFEDITLMAYIDGEVTGNIEINKSNKTVKVEVEMIIHYGKMKIILSWDNKDIK
jgi:hypothetical protein